MNVTIGWIYKHLLINLEEVSHDNFNNLLGYLLKENKTIKQYPYNSETMFTKFLKEPHLQYI